MHVTTGLLTVTLIVVKSFLMKGVRGDAAFVGNCSYYHFNTKTQPGLNEGENWIQRYDDMPLLNDEKTKGKYTGDVIAAVTQGFWWFPPHAWGITTRLMQGYQRRKEKHFKYECE